jgi:hypothetical protein
MWVRILGVRLPSRVTLDRMQAAPSSAPIEDKEFDLEAELAELLSVASRGESPEPDHAVSGPSPCPEHDTVQDILKSRASVEVAQGQTSHASADGENDAQSSLDEACSRTHGNPVCGKFA